MDRRKLGSAGKSRITKSAELTPEQIAWASELRTQGFGWRKIAHTIKGSEERLMRVFEPEKSIQFSMRGLGLDLPHANKARPDVPAHVLEERDRRLSMPRDLQRELAGDPEPGRSALDRRNQCATA